ncbi:ribosome silencing factor [Herminiimonas sp. KBW02]|uniref:ribosome silencing factor n=1 Tax=Herminiimonas sp. KBW02 TaxID=2153363 RepID=UPI000F59C9A2|nr:ribosome silencing factor [Herminiimonas sp. KBW02]RQO33069.1 ribosome silencing factor [Herminiimonas sp. KBW02]
MDIKKLQALVIDALEDVKAQDIKVFDTVHLTSLFDRIAVASGTSNRQTKALAASVRDKVKANGGEIVSIEGEDTGEWVLVDLGDMIVHIMQPAIRAYYRLEEIWGEKEVKFGAAKRTSKRAAGDEDEAPKKAAGRHLAASQTTLDDDEPKKPARKTAAAKTPAKKAPAKKAVGKTIKVAATKTAEAYKKAAPKKAPAKKVASKAAAKVRAPAKPKAKTAE